MPRKALGVPSYCLHKTSGQAVVRIGGRDVYLGPYGSEESKNEYARVLAECRVRREEQVAEASTLMATVDPSMTLSEVLLRYQEFAKGYYTKDGDRRRSLSRPMNGTDHFLHEVVPPLIAKWEPKLKVSVSADFLQRMKTKWGSCNHWAGNIRLNTELV